MTIERAGSCLCGKVRYVTSAEFELVGNCHCNTCKKATGGAFESFAIIDQEHFVLTAGDEGLAEYRISAKAKKTFCATCGTPLYNRHRLVPGKLIVHLGTLDEPMAVSPSVNLYCETMLPWVAEMASLRNFQQGFDR